MIPNILFISTQKTWRGGEFQIFELMKSLQNRVNVFVFCPTASELYHRSRENGITVFGYEKTFPTFSLTVANRLKKICRAYSIDLLHNNDSGALTFSYLSALLYENETPSVLSKRTIFPFAKGRLSIAKYTHKNLKRIICVSKAAQRVVLKNHKFCERALVINDGIDLRKYTSANENLIKREYRLLDQCRLIGYIGALTKEKGIPYLMDAFVEIKNQIPHIKLVIIGEGPMKKDLVQRARKCRLGDHVIFTGFRNDIPKIFKELDVFVLPSLAEGYPNVVMEAFASMVPVVATNVGGTPEILENGKNGLMVAPKNNRELAKSILKVLSNGEIAESIVKNAYRDARKKHSMEITAHKMFLAYKKAMGHDT